MKKLLTLSFISASLLFSGSPIHDKMDSRIKGKSYSGSLDDNTAAEDGLGILPLSSYSIPQDQANELLVQKILSDIERTETDKTKTVNIKDGLTAGTVGTANDLTLFNKYISAGSTGSFADLAPMTTKSQADIYALPAGSLEWIVGYGYGNTSSGKCIDYTNQGNTSYYNGMYFSKHIGTSEIQIKINDTVRMWSQAASGALTYDANMLLYKWNGTSWDNVSNLLVSVKGRTTYDFHIASKTLTPGTYKFTRSDEYATTVSDSYLGLRADNKWYFEKYTGVASYVSGSLTSCKDIKTSYPTSADGVYNLSGIGDVYCDMTTDGGGWTLVRTSNGTTSPDLRTEAAVNTAGLTSITSVQNAQLSSATVNALGTVYMAVNLAASYDTKVWFDRTKTSTGQNIYWTYNSSLPTLTAEPQASSIYPPSENKWGVDTVAGTHVNYNSTHPLCFGTWGTGGKGHFCYNRNTLDWWNYGADASTNNNGAAVTALFIR